MNSLSLRWEVGCGKSTYDLNLLLYGLNAIAANEGGHAKQGLGEVNSEAMTLKTLQHETNMLKVLLVGGIAST